MTCAAASTALIAAGLLGAAGAAGAAGTTVFVSSDGSDHAGCGTSASNQCATIQYGVNQATTGQTVQVAAGSYNEAVDITKAITLSGAGAATTTIDGMGTTAGDNGNGGLISIVNPGGDVTVTGFTITNAPESGNSQSFGIHVDDTTADTITVSHNSFLGDPDDAQAKADGPAGYYSDNTPATQDITDNTFTGLWQAVFSEGASGPISVDGNTFSALIDTSDGGSGTYPAEGVYINNDAAHSSSGQDVTDNTFTDYGGTGIKYSAGYANGGCATRTCDGSISGTVSGNTFDLTAAAGTTDAGFPAAALLLQAVNNGDDLALTVSGNTGTVAAPTVPVVVKQNAGSVDLTPGDTANTIKPTPAPKLTLTGFPTKTPALASATTFTAKVNNASGEALADTRYDVTITGDTALAASKVSLAAGPNATALETVALSGKANAPGGITGSFNTGASIPTGSTTTSLKFSVNSGSIPTGDLVFTVSLDQSGVNQLATTSATASPQMVVTKLYQESTVKGQVMQNVNTNPALAGVQINFFSVDAKGTQTDAGHATTDDNGKAVHKIYHLTSGTKYMAVAEPAKFPAGYTGDASSVNTQKVK